EVFNVGADQPYTVNYLAQVVCQAMGVEPNIVHLPPRNEVKHAFSSHEKVRRFFDVAEPVPLEEGIARMAAWVLQVGSRKTREFANIEIPRGLPAGW
ncbi:MAG: NAD-dependent epimerase/dehydratase family protein, partial [Anaerolineae bacterium]